MGLGRTVATKSSGGDGTAGEEESDGQATPPDGTLAAAAGVPSARGGLAGAAGGGGGLGRAGRRVPRPGTTSGPAGPAGGCRDAAGVPRRGCRSPFRPAVAGTE